jgi:hypothetical protein
VTGAIKLNAASPCKKVRKEVKKGAGTEQPYTTIGGISNPYLNLEMAARYQVGVFA